ncbi:transporter family protein [Sporobacter termitidis DSM 10068]|uniref:Transporter family protein n=1 Tax=Sporobacter termitidis DSM 10068 TaxID=1123282 RepID=A0A1M5WUG2_9FIRM|nr:EamA family transporter [Sporobacter termitidis]SHH91285.1 transporter family protein [Sporobacter termitidis DSM 10068]
MVYFFAIIGMICWGIAPFFAKMGLENVNPVVGLSVRTFFTAAVILLWLTFSGSIGELRNIPARTLLLLIVEALLATLIGDLAYFAALKRGSASIVMLIMSCSPVVTILCAILFLHERLTFTNLLGACLAIVGLILII